MARFPGHLFFHDTENRTMNTKKQWTLAGLLLVTVTAVTPALAASDRALEARNSFQAQRNAILDGLNGDKYQEITQDNRRKVMEALGRIDSHLDQHGATQIDRLPQEVAVAVFNDQNLINNILSEAADDSRLICRREKTIGSNFPQNNCLTVAERRRQKAQAQDDMVRLQRTPRTTD